MNPTNKSTPCKDCADRHLNCHSHCSRYQADAELRAADRKKRFEAFQADEILIRTTQKIMRKRRTNG